MPKHYTAVVNFFEKTKRYSGTSLCDHFEMAIREVLNKKSAGTKASAEYAVSAAEAIWDDVAHRAFDTRFTAGQWLDKFKSKAACVAALRAPRDWI